MGAEIRRLFNKVGREFYGSRFRSCIADDCFFSIVEHVHSLSLSFSFAPLLCKTIVMLISLAAMQTLPVPRVIADYAFR